MAVLTVDVGGSPLSLDCERGGHAAPRRVGPKTVGNSGAEESSIRGELMVIPLVLAPLPTATLNTLRALFALGAQVPCSGDIFNTPGTITCSGTITDQLHETGDRWTANLTLYEVGTTLTYTPATATIYLSPGDSPADPGDSSILLASADEADDPFLGFGGTSSLELTNGVTITTCGSGNCAVTLGGLEKTWQMPPAVNPGWLTGAWRIVFLSNGGTSDKWWTQSYMVTIFVDRGGVDVVEWDTGWSDTNAAPFGGDSTATSAGIVFAIELGDVVRFELYSRAGLKGGFADDGNHQTLTFGNGGAGIHYGRALISGDVLTIWP